ncbi:unnamed protein product [Effrenium voratum]|nr:unnamed protein product [Effrenium voratum]
MVLASSFVSGLLEARDGCTGLSSALQDYTFAIKTLGRKRLCQQALSILESMIHFGPAPNVIHFNAAITACESSGYWEGAVMLLQQMSFLGVTPDVVSFNAVISACGRQMQCHCALER